MKKCGSLLFCAVFLIMGILPTAAYTPTGLDLKAEAIILMNTDTQTLLYEKNADKPLHPASLTKIMTCALVLESGKDLDETRISVPKYALDLLLGTGSSMSGIKAGEEHTLRDLLYALMLSSGNDVANVLADYFGGGSIERFVQMMNQKAENLGMKNTRFVNPHGLTAEGHMTTARDMLTLTRHAFTLPFFAELVSTVSHELPATDKSPKRTLSNSNLMMNPTSGYYYRYVRGVKTGYTDEAGRCLITTASKDGYNYLAVVMNCPPKDAKGNSIRADFADTRALYEWAFQSFEYKEILTGTEPIAEVGVRLSWDTDHVRLVPKTPLAALIPKEANTSTVIFEPDLPAETVDAPVQKGAVLGTVRIVYAGEVIGSCELVAAESVARSRLLYVYDRFLEAVKSLYFKIALAAAGVLLVVLIVLTVILNKRKRRKRVRTYRRI